MEEGFFTKKKQSNLSEAYLNNGEFSAGVDNLPVCWVAESSGRLWPAAIKPLPKTLRALNKSSIILSKDVVF